MQDSGRAGKLQIAVPAATLELLTKGAIHPFSRSLHQSLPLARPGVYTIWNADQFLYVGIAGRGLDLSVTHKKMRGWCDRLDSHRSGRRSGDQFAIYVCDRLVLPTLLPEQIQQIAAGKLFLDALTKTYIHEHLGYRFAILDSYNEASAVETTIAKGGTPAGVPLLNAHRAIRRSPSVQAIEQTPGKLTLDGSRDTGAALG